MINSMSGRVSGIFLEVSAVQLVYKAPDECHSDPAVAGEESLVISAAILRGNSQRSFAKPPLSEAEGLNMTAPLYWTGLGGRQFTNRQATERFDVFRRRLLNHVLRQRRGRGSFVPIKRLQIIAYKLFVEAGRALSDRVFTFWPEARRVWREAFVDQKQFSIDHAKLEFRVCNDNSFLRGVLAATRVDFETERFHTIGDFVAENLSTLFHVDVLVMTLLRLCCWCEDWLWQLR